MIYFNKIKSKKKKYGIKCTFKRRNILPFKKILHFWIIKSANKNNMSGSGMRGITKNKINGKWKARIEINGKGISLGHFVDIKDAIKARQKGEIFYV